MKLAMASKQEGPQIEQLPFGLLSFGRDLNPEKRRIALFGAAPDTGNLGVSALYHSFLALMSERLPGFEPLVFDHGLGFRSERVVVNGKLLAMLRYGARGGHRYYRPENIHTMAALSRFSIGSTLNPGLAMLDQCTAAMDVSGGDSFSDIYGPKRFRTILAPKVIAVRRNRPLLLLPQTYGPFKQARHRKLARQAVLGASQAWARDPGSFAVLQDLLHSDFDPAIHRCGVDMAFGLPASMPPSDLVIRFQDWIDGERPLAGLNVSGLLWSLGTSCDKHFGFKADYRQLMTEFVAWLLKDSDVNLLLIPHVHASSGHFESDHDALKSLVSLVGKDLDRSRIRIAPDSLDETQAKWLIGRCDWFCGSRMHSTIAGLSMAVPTASVIYSDKALGVFETCGQSSQVVDPRVHETADCLEQLRGLFLKRDLVRERLRTEIERVRSQLAIQMDEIAAFPG